MNISEKKLVFVTGKGGVGKSVCAAALAWSEARKGRKVCLVELGDQSFYESFFETRGISYEPSEIVSDVHVALFNAENCLKEYVLHFLKVPKLYDLIFQNKVMKAFMNAAPAVSELSILGKLTSETRGIFKEEYDLYVVDCYSTGHALALLRAPKGMQDLFSAGPLAEQAKDINAVISNPELTHYVVVTLPEEMPVTETEELYRQLKNEFNAQVTLVCNKLLLPPLSKAEQSDLLNKIKDKNMHEFLEFVQHKMATQFKQWERLMRMGVEIFGIPLVLDTLRAQQSVEKISSYLDTKWTLTNS
jgi:anion-transporting  ArsA/GET3 family ATPase